MLFTLLCVTSIWLWTMLSFISIISYGPDSVTRVCPGSSLWYSLLVNALFTGSLSGLLTKMTIDAQSGYPVWGRHWPTQRKKAAAAGVLAAWLSLWIWAGVTTLGACPRRNLAAHTLRRINLVWFCLFPVAVGLVGAARCIKDLSSTYRRRRAKGASVVHGYDGRVLI